MTTLFELPNGSGSSRVRFQKYSANQNIDYQFEFKVNNGLYADEGSVIVKTIISVGNLIAERDGTSVKISYKKPELNQTLQSLTCLYRKQKILKTL